MLLRILCVHIKTSFLWAVIVNKNRRISVSIILIIHIIVSYDRNISLIFYVKVDTLYGFNIRLVFTLPPKDSTL